MAKDKEDDEKGKGKPEDELQVVVDDEKDLDVAPTGPESDDPDIKAAKVKDREAKAKKAKGKDADEDSDDDEEDEEEQEDTRLGKSEDKDDEAEDDERQRQPHKTRRQRRREAEMRLKRELSFLEGRNDQLERTVQAMARRLDANDKTNLETRIAHTKAMIKKAEDVMAEAHDAEGKGKELIEATRLRDNFRDDLKKLEAAKEKADQEPTEGREKPDPVVIKHAEAWAGQYDKFAGWPGTDLRIVRAIDDAVAEDGFDPRSPAYWKEMDKRIKKYLPHRLKASDEEDEDEEDEEEQEERPRKKKRKVAARSEDREDDDEDSGKRSKNGSGGPKFRTGGPGRELRPNEVYLSAERIAAMKEAGVWDDPILRPKYLKRYQEYDREHAKDQ